MYVLEREGRTEKNFSKNFYKQANVCLIYVV